MRPPPLLFTNAGAARLRSGALPGASSSSAHPLAGHASVAAPPGAAILNVSSPGGQSYHFSSSYGAGKAGVFALVAIAAAPLSADPSPEKLPFFAGEELSYRMRVGGLGTVAMGKMTVSGPTTMRGTKALLFTSEFKSTVAGLQEVGILKESALESLRLTQGLTCD